MGDHGRQVTNDGDGDDRDDDDGDGPVGLGPVLMPALLAYVGPIRVRLVQRHQKLGVQHHEDCDGHAVHEDEEEQDPIRDGVHLVLDQRRQDELEPPRVVQVDLVLEEPAAEQNVGECTQFFFV